MTCSHTNAFHRRGLRVLFSPGVESVHIDHHQDTGEPILSVIVDARQCLKCDEMLALDEPANDEPLAVKIELGAAALAASGYDIPGVTGARLRSMPWFQGCGWDSFDPDPDYIGHKACDGGEPEDGPQHLIGYLARAIADHKDPS